MWSGWGKRESQRIWLGSRGGLWREYPDNGKEDTGRISVTVHTSISKVDDIGSHVHSNMHKSMQNRLRRWDLSTLEPFSHGLSSKCSDLE